jgi:hypothetical protein
MLLRRYRSCAVCNATNMMLEVRSATNSDAEALADLFIRSERFSYQELKPARYLDGLDAVTELRRIQTTIKNTLTDIHNRLLVIEHDATIGGFAELHCEFDQEEGEQSERRGGSNECVLRPNRWAAESGLCSTRPPSGSSSTGSARQHQQRTCTETTELAASTCATAGLIPGSNASTPNPTQPSVSSLSETSTSECLC